MFVLAATGGLYLGCTERNNVANEGDEGGSAGSSSGAPGSGAAGSSSSAGSDATEGGSDGTGGSMGMSGAGLSDAGEPGQGMAGAGGDGSVPERPPAILVVGTDFGGVQATSYVNGAWDSVQVLAAPPLGGAMAAVLADGTGLAAMAGPYKGDEMGFYGASWDAPWATPRLVPGLIAADGVPILSRMSTFPGGALVAHTRNQNLGLTTYNATSESWTLDEDLGIAAAFHPAVSYVGTGDPLVVYFANGKYSSLRKVGSVWMGPTEVPITGEVIIEAPTNWEGYDGVHAEVDLVRRVGVDEVVGVFQTDQGGRDYSVFSNGTWSPGVRIANDAASGGLNIGLSLPPFVRHTAMAALPDGRVALAYWTGYEEATHSNVKVGFFDGSSWSEFKRVPEVTVIAYSPFAISRGASGAELELIFTGEQANVPWSLRHKRLTNEAAWTWTPEQVVDEAHHWVNISIAATP